MAHSHHAHREHVAAKHRVKHILKGHKHGGKVHGDEAADRKLFGKLIKEHDHKVHGKKSGGRLDKYARGGAAKKKHGTHINIVNVAPHDRPPSGLGAAPAAPGLPQGGGPPMPPPKPPMAGPPMGAPMGGPPGMPPGMMKPPGVMKRGGRAYKRGGKVHMTAGALSGEGRKQKIKAYGKNAHHKD